MNRGLMKFAILFLDNPNGVDIDLYKELRKVLLEECGFDGKELVENVTITNDVAFLNEDYAEDNFERFE